MSVSDMPGPVPAAPLPIDDPIVPDPDAPQPVPPEVRQCQDASDKDHFGMTAVKGKLGWLIANPTNGAHWQMGDAYVATWKIVT